MAPAETFPSTPTAGWGDADQVGWYLGRIDTLGPRLAGEEALRTVLPAEPRTLLDLGCGDGRLAALAIDARPTLTSALVVDISALMLEAARERFADDRRVSLRQWNLNNPIEALGSFDLIVSGFAIHHLEDDRKRVLYREISRQLNPGGLFANLEVVSSASAEDHTAFLDAIGRTADDPEDRLASVEDQLAWLNEAGFTNVDRVWQWKGFALLVGAS